VTDATDIPALARAALAAGIAEARVEDPDRPGATRDLDGVVVVAGGIVARVGVVERVRRLEGRAASALRPGLVAGEERVALDAGRALALHRAPELLRVGDGCLTGRRRALRVLDESGDRRDQGPARADLELVQPQLRR